MFESMLNDPTLPFVYMIYGHLVSLLQTDNAASPKSKQLLTTSQMQMYPDQSPITEKEGCEKSSMNRNLTYIACVFAWLFGCCSVCAQNANVVSH